jgi:hypothetical protein
LTVEASPIRRIADMGDVAKVKATILHEYGFEPTEEYCRDLIRFVEALIREQRKPV